MKYAFKELSQIKGFSHSVISIEDFDKLNIIISVL